MSYPSNSYACPYICSARFFGGGGSTPSSASQPPAPSVYSPPKEMVKISEKYIASPSGFPTNRVLFICKLSIVTFFKCRLLKIRLKYTLVVIETPCCLTGETTAWDHQHVQLQQPTAPRPSSVPRQSHIHVYRTSCIAALAMPLYPAFGVDDRLLSGHFREV